MGKPYKVNETFLSVETVYYSGDGVPIYRRLSENLESYDISNHIPWDEEDYEDFKGLLDS